MWLDLFELLIFATLLLSILKYDRHQVIGFEYCNVTGSTKSASASFALTFQCFLTSNYLLTFKSTKVCVDFFPKSAQEI